MSGDLIQLVVAMLVIALVAFAPLGYFILKFTQENGKPFGEVEPHGDSPSLVNDLAEKAIAFAKGLMSKQ
ncbi:hypothetical protein [Methylotuvimicrobium sp. KM2]|uniref:hypothetical protein n=1 Tax=Methylotuvimicrobium sp. KM2 TaxID=3133976 RepID=UPI003100EE98